MENLVMKHCSMCGELITGKSSLCRRCGFKAEAAIIIFVVVIIVAIFLS